MKRWMTGLLMLGLAACSPEGPNGKKEVLFFWTQFNRPVAEGFSATLTMLQHTSRGGGKSLTARKEYSYEFADSTLAVSTDSGLTVEKTWLDDEGHHVTYRCEPAAKSVREVRVSVLAPDGKERYADAYDVECGRPQALLVGVGNPDLEQKGPLRKFMLGADVSVSVTLQGRTDGLDSATLDGGKVSLVDPEGLLRLSPQASDSGRELYMEAVRVGRSPRVSLAGLEAEIPMEIVEDSSFQLEVKSTYSAVAPPLWTLQAYARHTDGSYVDGLGVDCEWEIRPLSGTPYTERGCYTYVTDSVGPGTACVRARGKTACAEYKR